MVDMINAHSASGIVGTLLSATWVTKAITASTDYAANDVMSDGSIWTFTNVVDVPGGSGEIKQALLINQNTQATNRVRMYFFNSSTLSATLTDNAANTAPVLADYSKAFGYIDFDAFSNKGTAAATSSFCPEGWGNTPIKFVCASDSMSIYAISVTLDAHTNELASAGWRCGLWIRKD